MDAVTRGKNRRGIYASVLWEDGGSWEYSEKSLKNKKINFLLIR